MIRRNGESLARTDPYARQVTRPHQNSVITAIEELQADVRGFPVPSLNELVIYELHVGLSRRRPHRTAASATSGA